MRATHHRYSLPFFFQKQVVSSLQSSNERVPRPLRTEEDATERLARLVRRRMAIDDLQGG